MSVLHQTPFMGQDTSVDGQVFSNEKILLRLLSMVQVPLEWILESKPFLDEP